MATETPNTPEQVVNGIDRFDALSNINQSGPVSKTALKTALFDESLKGGDESGQEEKDQTQTLPKQDPVVNAKTSGEGDKAEPSPSLFKVRLGDKEFDVPDEGFVTLKIDSKDVEVPVKDLKRNYQGKIPWERHYGELKRDKEKFEADKKTLDTWIDKVLDFVKTDPKQALLELVSRSGRSPAEYPELFSDELEGLDEKSKQVVLKAKDLEHKQKKLEEEALSRKKQDEIAQEQQRLGAYIKTKQQEHGITDQEIQDSYTLLQQTAEADVDGKLGLRNKTPQELADLVVNYVLLSDRPMRQTTSLIKELFPDVSPTRDDIEYINALTAAEKRRNPDLSKEDIAEIIKAVYSVDEVEEVAKPIKQATPSKESAKERKAVKPTTSPKTPQRKDAEAEDDDDPKTFEDLIRPYR